jgi:hypothetical protein
VWGVKSEGPGNKQRMIGRRVGPRRMVLDCRPNIKQHTATRNHSSTTVSARPALPRAQSGIVSGRVVAGGVEVVDSSG